MFGHRPAMGPVQQLLVGEMIEIPADGGGGHLMVGGLLDVDPPVRDELFQ